jgi:hypothetical protein
MDWWVIALVLGLIATHAVIRLVLLAIFPPDT